MQYTTPTGQVILLDDDLVLPGRLSIGKGGYAQVSGAIKGRTELLHRWLLGLTVGDGLIGDHINGDRYDNRRANLRILTTAESLANTVRTSALGLRGVHQQASGRYRAKGKVGGRQVSLGTYDTAEEAAEVAHRWRLVNLPGYTGRTLVGAR